MSRELVEALTDFSELVKRMQYQRFLKDHEPVSFEEWQAKHSSFVKVDGVAEMVATK